MKSTAETENPVREQLNWERKTLRKLIEIHPEFRSTVTPAKGRTGAEKPADNIIPFPLPRAEPSPAATGRLRLRIW